MIATETDLRCDGKLRDGRPCNKLILRARQGRVVLAETGDLEEVCPKCSKILRFFHAC